MKAKLAIYLLLGALCGTITAAFEPTWYVTLAAFWLGFCGGMLLAFCAAVFDRMAKALK